MPFSDLVATDLAKSYAGRTVLDGIDLRAAPGRRIGLIGENGVGKSTLLRLLAGVERPDSGTVHRPDDSAYLAQEPPFAGADTVATVLADALAPLHAAVADIERLSARMDDGPASIDRYARVLEWAEQHDAWDADRRAGVAAARLGISGIDPERQVRTLSGGQRTRLALAALITTRPGCVLLDEPTNHLDDAAMDMLEDVPRRAARRGGRRQPRPGLPGPGVHADRRSGPDRIRHRRPGRAAVLVRTIGRLHRLPGTPGAGPRPLGADVRRPAGGDRELRQATQIDTTRIAHDRGPRDNDKFIYSFKGGKVDRARVPPGPRRAAPAGHRRTASGPPAARRPAIQRATGIRFDRQQRQWRRSGTAVHVRDLRGAGPGRPAPSRRPVGRTICCSPAPTAPASRACSPCSPAGCGRAAGLVRVTARRIGLLEQDVVFEDPAEPPPGPPSNGVAGTGRGDALSRARAAADPARSTRRSASLSVGQRGGWRWPSWSPCSPDLLLLDEPTNHISLGAGHRTRGGARAPRPARSSSPVTTGGCGGAGLDWPRPSDAGWNRTTRRRAGHRTGAPSGRSTARYVIIRRWTPTRCAGSTWNSWSSRVMSSSRAPR